MQGVGLVLMVLSLGWATGDGGPPPEPLEEMVSDLTTDELQHQHDLEEEKEANLTSMWAVHVLGGSAVASQIASDLNAVNIGQVGSLSDHYNFELTHGSLLPVSESQRSRRGHNATAHAALSAGLDAHPAVLWSAHQHARSRRRRTLPYANVAADVPPNAGDTRARRSEQFSISDPDFPRQWHLRNTKNAGFDINVFEAWKAGYSGRGVVVTIVDDGIEHDHPDLQANYDASASIDINGGDLDPYPDRRFPINSHGTRCAGEVGAALNGVMGVGVAYGAKIGGVRMLDGVVTDAVEASSLSLNPQHIDVYTNSWGPNDDGGTVEGPITLTRKALTDGIQKGRGGKGSIYLFAAGNGGGSDDCNADGYTNSVQTITVGGIDEFGRKPYYTENCAALVNTAYGGGGSGRSIATTTMNHRFTSSHQGSSAAVPLVAGVVALALEANRNLSWRDVQHILVNAVNHTDSASSSWHLNAGGHVHSHIYGFGVVDAGKAVTLAKDWLSVGPHVQHTTATKTEDVAIVDEYTTTMRIEEHAGDLRLRTLEHVTATVSVSSRNRGNLEIYLTCPSGTTSTLMSERRDKSASGLHWTMMTVRCWDETPYGTYSFTVKSPYQDNSVLKSWSLRLYGSCAGDDCDSEPSTVHYLDGGGTGAKTVSTSPATAQAYGGTNTIVEGSDGNGADSGGSTPTSLHGIHVTSSAAAGIVSPYTTSPVPTTATKLLGHSGSIPPQQRNGSQRETDGSPSSSGRSLLNAVGWLSGLFPWSAIATAGVACTV